MTPSVPDIVVLGPTSGPRHDSFARACIAETGRAPRTIGWDMFLAEPGRLERMLRPGSWLRVDTPDQDVRAIAALYRAGEERAAEREYETVPAGFEDRLAQGDIGSPAQLCMGIVVGLELAEAMALARGATISTTAIEVAEAFDKSHTQAGWRSRGIATPRELRAGQDFASLEAAMRTERISRVFVKLRYGAAAAGMIALARNGDCWKAVTTAELQPDGRIRATRRVQQLTDRAAIARLVDRLGPLGLHVEPWLPKIGIGNRVADVRLVLVRYGGMFPVLRTSRHPMTNLHLGGRREPIEPLIERIGRAAWDSLRASAHAAASFFPTSQVLGLDIAVLADGRHAMLEANVFGDFVKGVTVDGLCPHGAQVRQIVARLREQAAA